MSNIDSILNLNEELLLSLKPHEKEAVLQILKEIESKGKSESYLKMLEEDYEEMPVDIDTFICDDRFIGKITDHGKNVYPYWRNKLREIFSPDNNFQEIIFTGAIGLGKTTIAVMGMSYILYKLLCLKNPQNYYGLQSNSKIVIAFFNVNLDLSYGVAYKKMQSMLLESPWFLEHGKVYGRDEKNKWFQPDKGIEFRVGSQENHGLGQDIFCISGDSIILTSEGDKKIEDLEDSWVFVMSEDKGKPLLSNLCKVVCSGFTKEIYKLTFDNGYTLQCTGDHRLRLSSGEYKMVKYLNIGDDIRDINIIN